MAAPWLMWGSAQNAVLQADPSTGDAFVGGQIARIDYARPDTWTFFFAALINNLDYAGAAVPALTLKYDLTIGLGRSQITLNAFETYQWDLPADVTPRYSQSVVAPVRRTGVLGIENMIRDFPAQSINLGFRAELFVPAGAPCMVNLEVQGYFAPRTHVRPEWMTTETAQFRGGENGGM